MRFPPIDELEKKAGNKYLLVMIAAKRAREIVALKNIQIENPRSPREVGIALEEFYADKLEVTVSGQ